jgi:hypothetical protein
MAVQISANSFSTVTNIRFGSTTLKDFWWNVTSVVLPTISLAPPEINTRSGANIALAADTAVYSDLAVTLVIDKDWLAYDMIYSYFLEGLNVDTGKFSHFKDFDLWLEVLDGTGNVKKKFWFYSCRITDISGIIASPEDTEDTLQVLDVTFNVMYFKMDRPEYLLKTESMGVKY